MYYECNKSPRWHIYARSQNTLILAKFKLNLVSKETWEGRKIKKHPQDTKLWRINSSKSTWLTSSACFVWAFLKASSVRNVHTSNEVRVTYLTRKFQPGVIHLIFLRRNVREMKGNVCISIITCENSNEIFIEVRVKFRLWSTMYLTSTSTLERKI